MRPGPMESSADAALTMRAAMHAAGELEHMELVEIDALNAVRRLMRKGSPWLRQALAAAVHEYSPPN